MEGIHLFPFEFVPRGANIIIYGVGNVGSEFIQQIQKTKWCNVLFAVDRNYLEYPNYILPVYNIDQLLTTEYDYVVIGIKKKNVIDEIKSDLICMGVEENKIIGVWNREMEEGPPVLVEGRQTSSKILRVGFFPTGGMGDYIIALKIFERLVQLDIFCREGIGRAVYAGLPNVNQFINGSPNHRNIEEYDVVLRVEHLVHVIRFDYETVKLHSMELAQILMILYQERSELSLDGMAQAYKDAILLKRASMVGKNRYTMMDYKSLWNITDQKVNLPIDESYEEEFCRLNLGRYITINRGADRIQGESRTQVKVWPKAYYEELNRRIKREFPDINIVQLGSIDDERIEGCHNYILGQKFELVKHILRNSLLHIDCEGGLVHMAAQFGTQSIVLFGPTPVGYYGYEQNINIVSEKCKECMGVTKEWFVECYQGLKEPECMYSITPERVFAEFKKSISKKLDTKIKVE